MNRNIYDSLRKRIHTYFCIYCGNRADSDEHFPPIVASKFGFILRACKECNLIANATYATNFSERASFVKKKLFARYGKLLRQPEWSVEELSGMSYSMRDSILKIAARQKEIKDRLNWDWRAGLATTDSDDLDTF